MAWEFVREAHKAAAVDSPGLDAKAAGTRWIATIFAIALFQSVGAAEGTRSPLIVFSFLCLVAALLLAIRAQKASDVLHASIRDPLDIYEYQTTAMWDYTEPKGCTVDDVAEAQTKMKLIQQADAAIKALREASCGKQRLIRVSHWFFGARITLLALSITFPYSGPICQDRNRLYLRWDPDPVVGRLTLSGLSTPLE